MGPMLVMVRFSAVKKNLFAPYRGEYNVLWIRRPFFLVYELRDQFSRNLQTSFPNRAKS